MRGVQTLFNLDSDGSLLISERDFNPDGAAEVTIPAQEIPALRAFLSGLEMFPGASSYKASEGLVSFNNLQIRWCSVRGLMLEQLEAENGRYTHSIEISPDQVWAALRAMARTVNAHR